VANDVVLKELFDFTIFPIVLATWAPKDYELTDKEGIYCTV
jgi:hypothetical protein